jgi:hypothetical protein
MHQSSHMKECIEACNDCRDECEKTLFQHCLKMGGEHTEQGHVTLMSDCIEICQTAANFMLRGSDNASDICNACADICDLCADSCEKIGGDMMESCAETCRNCANICREMGNAGMQGRDKEGGQRPGRSV